jgi:pSer/pThr/pTyr-binding forkhead associated (FHA) protein
MEEFVEISIDVLEIQGQRAKVRRTLTIDGLKDEIFREFEIDSSTREAYALLIKGGDRPINPHMTLTQLDAQPHDEFVLTYTRRSVRNALQKEEIVYVVEESTQSVFEIQWQPAVIGRPDIDPEHNLLLAINLESLPNGKKISRAHAQITFSAGHYYIESLNAKNPTTLNNEVEPLDRRRELHDGDKIHLTNNALIHLTFRKEHPDQKGGLSESQQVEERAEPKTEIVHIQRPVLSIEKSGDPEYQGKTIEITPFPYQIGRENCTLTLLDETISRRHAEISFEPEAGKYFLTDLKSSNGTILNLKRIPAETPLGLESGDVVYLGPNTQLKFLLA